MRRKLDEITRRVKVGLDEIQGWPLRTSPKAVLAEASAMTFAAQASVEETGSCWHQVVFLGENQKRFGMMCMTGGETREEKQQHKQDVWQRVGQLFNLLDADVMLWLQDAWYVVMTPEREADGGAWASEEPDRKEVLNIIVITPTKQVQLACEYERRSDGTIGWSDFSKATSVGGGFQDAMLGQMVQEYRYLKPAPAVDGQVRHSALAGKLITPQRILAELEELGQYVHFIDERFLRMN
jgi:hypothetical protein